MPHRQSSINAANLNLQQALEEMIKISQIMLQDTSVFNKAGYRKAKQDMESLEKQARDYYDQLLRHSNTVNAELFDNINGFLQEQAKFIEGNMSVFEELLQGQSKKSTVKQLKPMLDSVFEYTKSAIEKFTGLKSVASQLSEKHSHRHASDHKHGHHAEDEFHSMAGQSMLGANMSANIENVLTNLLKQLPEIIKAYQGFMGVLNNVLVGGVKHESHKLHSVTEHKRPSSILHQHKRPRPNHDGSKSTEEEELRHHVMQEHHKRKKRKKLRLHMGKPGEQ